jgi:hypothetical protein
MAAPTTVPATTSARVSISINIDDIERARTAVQRPFAVRVPGLIRKPSGIKPALGVALSWMKLFPTLRQVERLE